jgi:hypothetical protein
VFAIVNSSCEESPHHHRRGTLSAAAQLVLRDRRVSAAIAELDIQKLPDRNVDFDTAVLGGSLWYRDNRWEAGNARASDHSLKVVLLPTFDAYGCHDAYAEYNGSTL